jgi:hypothetical protein
MVGGTLRLTGANQRGRFNFNRLTVNHAPGSRGLSIWFNYLRRVNLRGGCSLFPKALFHLTEPGNLGLTVNRAAPAAVPCTRIRTTGANPGPASFA